MAIITTTAKLKAEYPALVDKIIKEALGEDTESIIQITKDKDKNITEWVEELKDLDGKLISKRVDTYTYKHNGEVDIITQQRFNDKLELVSETYI